MYRPTLLRMDKVGWQHHIYVLFLTLHADASGSAEPNLMCSKRCSHGGNDHKLLDPLLAEDILIYSPLVYNGMPCRLIGEDGPQHVTRTYMTI